MNRHSQWWALGALVTVALLAAMILGVRQPGEQTSQAPTSYSPLPYGTKAFFVTLERLGYNPRRWRFDWSRLDREQGVMIYAPADPITAAGRHKPLSASAARAMSRWLERGNTLLYFMNSSERVRGQNVLLDELNVVLDFAIVPAEYEHTERLRQFLPTRTERDYDHILPVPWAAGVQRLTSDALPGFSTDQGHAIVLTESMEHGHVSLIPHGKGRAYIFSSAGFMDNHFLARSDNLTFLLNILDLERGGKGSVLFDEYHHGFSSEFGAVNLTQLPVVRFAALQALLLALLFVVTSWRRFGKPVPLARDARRSIREYTQSLGNLYARARAHREVLEFLFQELRRSLCSRYNLPHTASHAVVEDRLRVQRGAAEAWNTLAHDCDRLLSAGRIGNRDLLAASRKIEAFRKLIA